MPREKRTRTVALLLAIAWVAFVAVRAISAWPAIPLDMAGDAATREALSAARSSLAVRACLAAAVVPLGLWLLVRSLARRNAPRA